MRKFKITIWFEHDEKGKAYELEKMVLVTKKMTLERAKKIGIEEAEKCWPHYEIDLESFE